MRHTLLSTTLAIVFSALVPSPSGRAAEIIDFEDLPLPAAGYLDARSDPQGGGFSSGGAFFHWGYDATWDIASGFAASNISDTQNYQGQDPWNHAYNAIPGSGAAGSSAYAVAYASPPAVLDLPADPLSIDVTNTTYAYYSMLEGDGFAKKFGGPSGGDADWFRLVISGLDAAGSVVGEVETMLADFRSAEADEDYILDTWRTVDLSGLAGARQLQFRLESSDVSEFGMNTPAYLAVDNLVVVPEPSAGWVLLAAFAALAGRRRRRLRAGRA